MSKLLAFLFIMIITIILSSLFITPVFGLGGLSITEAIGFSILANSFNGSIVKYKGKL